MKEDTNTPSLRFKGFEGEWEERKLESTALEILAGGDIDNERRVDNGQYPIYANALTNDGIVGYYNDFYRVKAPAVTVTGRGEVGCARVRETNFTPVVRLLAIRTEHDCFFLEKAINNHSVIEESTGVPQLTVPQLASYDLYIPQTLQEERKIGAFFAKLDQLIFLQKQKIDKLEDFKQAMLEKMFPQKGSMVPKIRFRGFEEEWMERNTSDLAEYSKRYGYSKSDLSETGTPIILYGRLYTNYQFSIESVDTNAIAQPNSIFSQGNEVIVPASGETAEDIARASAVMKPGVILGGDLNIIRPVKSIVPVFLALSLSNGSSKQELARMAQGKSIVHIHNADIKKLSIAFPSYCEQGLIVEFFSQLDLLLSLHRQKLEKLQSIKKALLGQMFPSTSRARESERSEKTQNQSRPPRPPHMILKLQSAKQHKMITIP